MWPNSCTFILAQISHGATSAWNTVQWTVFSDERRARGAARGGVKPPGFVT